MEGYVLGQPSVVSCSDNTVEVVVKSYDGAAYYQAWVNGSWRSSWTSLGGVVVGNAEIQCTLSSGLVVYARSTDGRLYKKTASGSPGARSFGIWQSVGNPAPGFIGTPAVSFNPNAPSLFREQVLVRGTDDAVYQLSDWAKVANGPVTW
jgi:hypothetical protein